MFDEERPGVEPRQVDIGVDGVDIQRPQAMKEYEHGQRVELGLMLG